MKPVLRFHLTDETLSAWIVQRGELRQVASFRKTSAGFDECSRFLSGQAPSGHLLLLDHAAPQLTAEALPSIGFLAHRRMLALRLQRLHPDTRWRCALAVPAPQVPGRTAAFLALPETPSLQDWLNNLAAATLRLRGIHSAPLLLAAFLTQRRRLPDHLLVVSQHDQATRFCLMHHGCPVALTEEQHLPGGDIPEAINHFSRCNRLPGEIEAAPASLCLLGTADWQDGIAAPAHALRIPTRHANSCIDLLALPIWRWPRARLTTPPMLQQEHRRIGLALWLGGTAAGIGSLALTLTAQSTLENLNANIDRSRHQLLSLEREIDDLKAKATGLGIAAETLTQLPSKRNILSARRDAFARCLYHLGAALDASPGVELETLSWTAPSDHFTTTETWQMRIDGHLSPGATPAAIQQLIRQLHHHKRMQSSENTATDGRNFSLNLKTTPP